MATMNISLPDELKAYIESKSARGPYSNNSDYIRDLVRRDQARDLDIEAKRRIIEEARASGRSTRSAQEIREDVLAEWQKAQ